MPIQEWQDNSNICDLPEPRTYKSFEESCSEDNKPQKFNLIENISDKNLLFDRDPKISLLR